MADRVIFDIGRIVDKAYIYTMKGGISKNSIWFCLKIWNLWKIPHPWVGGWVGWWMRSGQIIKNF